MPQAAAELLTAHPPLLVAGTTASGKDAVENFIQGISDWRHVVTHTTRQIRPGEVNGSDYWFVSEAEMLNLAEGQAFIEIKLIHDRQISGTSIQAYNAVLAAGRKPMLRIDIQGVRDLRTRVPGLRPYFILPPSFDVWMERLDKRGHMSHVERVQRLHSARLELETAIEDEHFILLINDEIARVAQEIVDGVTDIPSQQRNRQLARQLIDHIKAY